MSQSLLYADRINVNNKISIRIPTVGEVLEAENEYFGLVAMITATPSDMMVRLDDAGIDFTSITDYDLFCLLFSEIQNKDTSLIFGDLDLKAFKPMINPQNGLIIFADLENDIVIDKAIYDIICRTLRWLLYITKNTKKPANDEAKKFMIERARKKLLRQEAKMAKNLAVGRRERTQLESLIISLVNTEQFSYDYNSVRSLTMYQFYSSVHQIIKKIKYDNTMTGCYAGTVSVKNLDPEELNWLAN